MIQQRNDAKRFDGPSDLAVGTSINPDNNSIIVPISWPQNQDDDDENYNDDDDWQQDYSHYRNQVWLYLISHIKRPRWQI